MFRFDISFEIRTFYPNGLLLALWDSADRWVAVFVRRGRIVLSLTEGTVHDMKDIADGDWHQVRDGGQDGMVEMSVFVSAVSESDCRLSVIEEQIGNHIAALLFIELIRIHELLSPWKTISVLDA